MTYNFITAISPRCTDLMLILSGGRARDVSIELYEPSPNLPFITARVPLGFLPVELGPPRFRVRDICRLVRRVDLQAKSIN